MRALVLFPICFALTGCSVALFGNQTASGGAATTTTSVVTTAQASAGAARVGASFGAPAPQGAAGGQAVFPRGASVVLVLGLIAADALNYLSTRFSDAPAARSAPQRSIADTCSCYGYQPPTTNHGLLP
jgi:hypothetical protein